MKKLTLILKEKWTHLNRLEKVLADEQQLLCAGRVQNASLQKITEKKGTLLELLAGLDKYRLDEEAMLGLAAPYADIPTLNKQWINVQKLITSLHRVNTHNGRLLEQHINHNTGALDILSTRHQVSLYGPDGQTCKLNPNRRTGTGIR